jgi:hypothetical protein
MKTPALQSAWHHLTAAQVCLIRADDTQDPVTPEKRRDLIAEAQDHSKQADVILKQHLAIRQP